jgi:hypothetical protein
MARKVAIKAFLGKNVEAHRVMDENMVGAKRVVAFMGNSENPI